MEFLAQTCQYSYSSSGNHATLRGCHQLGRLYNIMLMVIPGQIGRRRMMMMVMVMMVRMGMMGMG